MDAYGRINNSSRVVYRQLSFHQWMNSVIKVNQKNPSRIPKTIAEGVQRSSSHPTPFVKFGPSLILAVIYPNLNFAQLRYLKEKIVPEVLL